MPQDDLPDDTVRNEWLRRVEAEYRSGAHAHHLTLWLLQLGAPPELINMGLRIVSDELVHAELSDEVHRAAGGSAAPTLPRESLALHRHPSDALEHDVLRVGVEMFCLGETVAVRLFSRLRDTELEPVVDKALERILRDEVFHRDFGWALLDWLLQTAMADAFRGQLARELPAMLKRVRNNYGGVALDRVGADALARLGAEMPAGTRRWGVMPIADYLRAVDETFERDYEPRFAALDVAMPQRAAVR